MLRKPNARSSTSAKRAAPAKPNKMDAPVKFTHPDRIYWTDVEITKQQLADYYTSVWDYMAPHVVNRPLALVRCPTPCPQRGSHVAAASPTATAKS